jgi:hypothetical protein
MFNFNPLPNHSQRARKNKKAGDALQNVQQRLDAITGAAYEENQCQQTTV